MNKKIRNTCLGTVNGVNMIGLALQGPSLQGLTVPTSSTESTPKKGNTLWVYLHIQVKV